MSKSVTNALRNSFFQTFGAFTVSASNFILMIAYARILGPESYGVLASSQAQVLVWLLLVELGLSNGLIGALTAAEGGKSELSRQGFRARDLVKRVLALRLLGASIGALGVACIAYTNARSNGDLDYRILWRDLAFVPHLFAFACLQTASAYSMFAKRQGLSVLATLVGTVITVALPILLAMQGADIAILLLSQSWGGFLGAFIIIVAFLWRPRKVRRRLRKNVKGPWANAAWRAMAMDAWPYACVFAATALLRIDVIIASKLLGNEAAGNYSLAVRLTNPAILIATSITLALFPELQRVGRDAPEKIYVYLGFFTKFLFRNGIFIAAIIVTIVALIISPIVEKYRAAIFLLPWFIPGIWAFWLHSFLVNGLFGLRKYWEVVKAHIIATVTFLVLLYPCTSLAGLQGLAIAFDSFSVALFFSSYHAARKCEVLPKGHRLMGSYSEKEKALLVSVAKKLVEILPFSNPNRQNPDL